MSWPSCSFTIASTRALKWLWIALCACCFTNCQTAKFYGQAIRGHLEILQKSQPVEDVIASPQTPQKLREKLQLTQRMLDYAITELGLPAQHQYRRYADLGRENVSWVVCAAPEFSVEPKRWWYPLVGRLSYRGYFSASEANAMAQELKAEGYDVLVSEVNAYSTLGYFHDPLLNTFIDDAEPSLAELLFHELTHQRLYLPGKTEFNEALATTVGQTGAQRWLTAQGKPDLLQRYNQALKAISELQIELGKTETQLKKLYAESATWPLDKRRSAKAAIFDQLRSTCLHNPVLRERKGIQKWLSQPLSNAHLALHQTYHALVPALEKQLQACGGDYRKFLREVKPGGD